MQVELDKVIKVIEGMKDSYVFKHNPEYVDSVVMEKREELIEKIKALAYGKTYKCLNCGSDIFFNKKVGRYMHVGSNCVCCDSLTGDHQVNQIAMPTPESIAE